MFFPHEEVFVKTENLFDKILKTDTLEKINNEPYFIKTINFQRFPSPRI